MPAGVGGARVGTGGMAGSACCVHPLIIAIATTAVAAPISFIGTH